MYICWHTNETCLRLCAVLYLHACEATARQRFAANGCVAVRFRVLALHTEELLNT